MGALIMTHSDDNGLVLPPHLAPIQVVIVPIFKKQDDLDKLMAVLAPLADKLKAKGIRVKVDTSDKQTPGFKFADYELKGVPVRIAMGGRDLENGTIEVARRDTLSKETIAFEGVEEHIAALLEEIQQNIYKKALDFRLQNTREVNSYEEFKEEIQKGGFLLCHWDGTPETEEKIKEETKATIRCIPQRDNILFNGENTIFEEGRCMVTGKPSKQRVVFAIAY
jgi:prolyl-tRNA synthetase